MLSSQELDEVKEHVLRELTRVLEQDPRFALLVEGILAEKFPRRDEFARLLDEVTASRNEQREAYSQIVQRLDGHDQRFDAVDQRFDAVDQRFDAVDQRFDTVERDLSDLKQGLGEVRDGLGEVREEVGELRVGLGEVREGLGAVNQRLDEQIADSRGFRDWFQLLVGELQDCADKRWEDVVAGALRYGLRRPDVLPEQIRLRQCITDSEGLFFPKGATREVDLVAQDGEMIVFEVKSAPDWDDVVNFSDKVRLLRHQNPDKRVSGVFVALTDDPQVRQECEAQGITPTP